MVVVSSFLLLVAGSAATVSAAVIRSQSSEVQISSNVLSLTRKPVDSRAFRAACRSGGQAYKQYGTSNISIGQFQFGQVFLTNIQFGGETRQVVVDTGSSDTWVVGSGFQCLDVNTHKKVAESQCAFGATYNTSKTFQLDTTHNFNITYGDGETLTGVIGKEHISLAGIEIKDQTIAVVEKAAWYGDGISSGLLGLGFPNITHEYTGSDPSKDSDSNQVLYNPLFTSMYQEGLTAPLFSLALSRSNASPKSNYGGVLAIGGLPPVNFAPNFATVPIEYAVGDTSFVYYTLTIDSLVYEGSEKTNFTGGFHGKKPSAFQSFVDSGTPSIEVPTAHANAFNALFSPPALYNDDQGAYVTKCNAKVPKFGVTIGGQTFYINPLDLLVPIPGNNFNCTTGIADGGEGLQTLGDVFLTNVVAVFDLGAKQMKFASRELY